MSEKTMEQYIVQTHKMSKDYKDKRVVRDVNIHVPQGSIYGFVGRNGAGKTTCMKMITGFASPTAGSITLFPEQKEEGDNTSNRIGTLIERPAIYEGMSVYDNLKMKAICYDCANKDYIHELAQLVGIKTELKKKAGKLSLGMKQRLGIALALIGDPKLLVLDEPMNGLDPEGMADMRAFLLKLNREKGVTIMTSSHILGELSKIATHYGFINYGSLVEEVSAEELKRRCEKRIDLKVSDAHAAANCLKEHGISEFKIVSTQEIHIVSELPSISQLVQCLADKKNEVLSVHEVRQTLEEYYFNLTGRE